jgi:RHS repeat-associated protein
MGEQGIQQTLAATANWGNSSGHSYDAAGNMTDDGFHMYKYDAEGNIISVDSGSTATYSYDALNHRGRSIVGSTVDEFVYNSSGQRASIWNGNTRAVIQGQYYWGNKRVAYYSGGTLHFQHQDWMGTEHIRSSYNGGSDGQFTSLPFGDDLTTASGTDTDAYHFAQIDHDYESDTEHAQFRQYSSAQGRFLSPDPYGGSYDPSNPQSFNRYVYALNNPLSNVDPSGRECVWDDGSYDASDDPDTGTAEGCGAAGGTFVPPEIFESVEGTNPGSWSPNANAQIQNDWTTVSETVSAGLCPGPVAGTIKGAEAMGIAGPIGAGAQALAMMTGHVVTVGVDASAGLKFATFGGSVHGGYSLAFDPQGGIALISVSGTGGGGFAGDAGVTFQFGMLNQTSVLTITNTYADPNLSIAGGNGIMLGASTNLNGEVTSSAGLGEGIQTGLNLDSSQVNILTCGASQ